MSFSAQTWARKITVGNGIAKAVLRHLADVADGGGYSHYGFETLCREVEFTPRAVTKAVAYLIKRGLLEKTVRRSGGDKGRWLAPQWRVLIPGLAPANPQGLDEVIPCESAPPNSPCESAPPNPVYPCENDSFTPANSQGNPTRESKEEKKVPSLRSGDAALPVAAGTDIRTQLYSEGKQIIRRVTGRLNGAAGGIITDLLKAGRQDCAVVLACLRAAESEGVPADGFVGWVTNGVRKRISTDREFDPNKLSGAARALWNIQQEREALRREHAA
jgi:hypothetical protein